MANVELVSGWRDFGVCAHQGEIDGGGLEGLEVADREPPRDLLLQHRLLLRVLHSVAVLHVGVLAVVRVALISIILIRGVLEQGDLLVVVRHDVVVLGGRRRLALQPLEEPAQRTRTRPLSAPTARMPAIFFAGQRRAGRDGRWRTRRPPRSRGPATPPCAASSARPSGRGLSHSLPVSALPVSVSR